MNTRRLFLPLVAVLAFCGQRVWSAEDVKAPAEKPGYTVNLDLHINEDGVPESVNVADSQDPTFGEVMDKMAIAMLLKRDPKFEPRTKDGHRIRYTARIPFYFPAIEGDEGAESNKGPKPSLKAGGNKPVYPRALIDQKVVGGAILELVVNTEGKIARLTTLRASHQEFEQAATQAVNTWAFTPAQKDGKPVESRVRIAVVFETKSKMADLKWRIPPRPSLGTFVVGYDDTDYAEAPKSIPVTQGKSDAATPVYNLPGVPDAPAKAAPAK